MKRELWMLFVVNGGIILFLFIQAFDALTMLINEDVHSDILVDADLVPVEWQPTRKLIDLEGTEIITLEPDRPLIIPKIIHQTYATLDVPDKWNKTYNSVRLLHPDYEYMFWTDDTARQFIDIYFNWFLETYDSYPYNIMRADVIRYFVLVHYGGIYIDLDNGCDFSMDPLRAFPAWLRKTDPTGVSNDIMGSVPRHPFFLMVLEKLKAYNVNYGISYLTIMYSTGPLFLSVIRKQYKRLGLAPPGGEVRILLPVDHGKHTRFFFFQGEGSSWHQNDANFILFLGDHIILVIITVIILVGLFLYGQYLLYKNPLLVFINLKSRLRRVFRFFYLLVQRAFRASSFSPKMRPTTSSSIRSPSPSGGSSRSFLLSVLDDYENKADTSVHDHEASEDDDSSDDCKSISMA